MAAELGCRGYHTLDVGQFGGNFSKDRVTGSSTVAGLSRNVSAPSPAAPVSTELTRTHALSSRANAIPSAALHGKDFWRLSIFRGVTFGFSANGTTPTWELPCAPGMSPKQCLKRVGTPEVVDSGILQRPTVHLGLLTHQQASLSAAESDPTEERASSLARSREAGGGARSSRWPACLRTLSGVTCVADVIHKHSASKIAHFAKRVLPWFSMHTLAGERCDTFALPATPQRNLTTWFMHMIRLTLGESPEESHAAAPPRFLWREDFTPGSRLCFETVKISYKMSTYFRNESEALSFKQSAWATSGVPFNSSRREPLSWMTHHRIRGCLLQRVNGRNPSNLEAIRATVLAVLRNHLCTRPLGGQSEGGAVRGGDAEAPLVACAGLAADSEPLGKVQVEMVVPSEHMDFAEQVRLFAGCDVLLSPHGSQNANVIFMQSGEWKPYPSHTACSMQGASSSLFTLPWQVASSWSSICPSSTTRRTKRWPR